MPTTIFHAMVVMLVDWHCKTFTSIYPLTFEVNAVSEPKLNDGVNVIPSTISHTIKGVWGLGTMGGVNAHSIIPCHLLKTFRMSCPYVAFNYVNTFSLCNITFSLPSSLDFHVFNFFKAFKKGSFKVFFWKKLLR